MPTQARIIDTCAAAAAQINAAAATFLPHRFEAEKSYATWDEELRAIDKLQIDAVPSRYERAELLSRTRFGFGCSIEIYVRQKFGPNFLEGGRPRDASIDSLVRLVEQLWELFATEKVSPIDPTIKWTDGQILTACSRPHLRNKQTFFGALKLSFDAPRTFTPA